MTVGFKRLIAAGLTAGLAGLAIAGPTSAETLRLAHIYQPDSPSGLGFQRFADLVEQYSDGAVEVRVFPAGQMGSMRDIFTSLRSGAVDVAPVVYPILADIVPEYGVLMAGFTFRDPDHVMAVLDDPELGGAWNEELTKRAGIIMLGNYYYGSRVVSVGDRAFHSPEEAQGLKIRAVPNPMSLAVIRGLGANPTPMPFSEVFISLSQGVIDGQENPYPTIWAQKFYEVQDYIVETNHQINFLGIGITQARWDRLSAEEQEAIQRAASEATAFATEETVANEGVIREQLIERGMTIVTPDELNLEAFAAAVQGEVAAEFEGKVWPEGLLEKVGAVK